MEKVSKLSFNIRIAVLALTVFVVDQLTKFAVVNYLHFGDRKVIVPGFFDLVHWGNTGAAWSMFRGNNHVLALVAVAALLVLFFARHHFEIHTLAGQISLGLIFGGIVGNLTDRLLHDHVIDFLHFYVFTRNGGEASFPAFNVADTAICTGVGLLFVASWVNESRTSVQKG
jgi:signal peptidase II